jgi:SpoVK/Ycf46/Vps4 family AAA+-type ATPase
METGQRVTVTAEHVQQALDRSRPSVSEKELQRYARFRDDGE